MLAIGEKVTIDTPLEEMRAHLSFYETLRDHHMALAEKDKDGSNAGNRISLDDLQKLYATCEDIKKLIEDKEDQERYPPLKEGEELLRLLKLNLKWFGPNGHDDIEIQNIIEDLEQNYEGGKLERQK